MTRMVFVFSFLWLCACATEGTASLNNAAYALEIAKGQATSAAIETNARYAAEAIATNDARTQVATDRDSTRAAQMQLNAMLYAQASSTAQSQYANATATTQYVTARASETAQYEAAQFSATQNARIANTTATSEAHKWQTTATAERRMFEAQQAQTQATATAQAIALQIRQAQADALEAAQWNAFVQSALRFAAMILGMAMLFGLLVVLIKETIIQNWTA